MHICKSKEAARAVFDIGATTTDRDIRGTTWGRLGRNHVYDPGFTSVLLDDLANYPDDEVRTMAAYALAPYVDDPVARTALERTESDASFEIRYAARKVLGMIPD